METLLIVIKMYTSLIVLDSKNVKMNARERIDIDTYTPHHNSWNT